MVAPRLFPASLLRRLLPFAAFLTAFSVVMTILFISTDFKAPRHRPTINLTDLDFRNVAQDDPQFIAYIRAVHLHSPSSPVIVTNHDSITNPPPQTKLVAQLFHFQPGGTFMEVGAYRRNRSSDTEWLEKELGWKGLLVQPDPRDYLTMQAYGRNGAHSIHACLSPTPYPKEVTFRENELVFTRVKCFPVYSLLLAVNTTNLNYLSLDAEGAELQVLKTIPMDRVQIGVIGVAWQDHVVGSEETTSLLELMASHKYNLVHKFKHMYLFQLNNSVA